LSLLNMRLLRKSLVSFVLAGGFLAGVSAHAMTRNAVEMVCPYDGVKFTFNDQMSGTSFDKRLDWMPVGAIESPWPLAACPTNGFVFLKEKYDADELERLRPLILSAEYQGLKGETPYYRAAWIKERTGAPHPEVSRWLLQATWQATGEQYSRYATELVARLSVDIADKTESAEQHIGYRLLTGEILRRLGRFEEADGQFVALTKDLEPASNEAKIVAFQRRLIADKDIRAHLISEALGKSR